jgi:hypothetical protein
MSVLNKGDFVIGKSDKPAKWLKKPSEVVEVYESHSGDIALVKFEDSIVKIRVKHLVKAEEALTLTKTEYLRLTEQVIQRDNFDISDSSYEILSATAPLLFKRLELLLFGDTEG